MEQIKQGSALEYGGLKDGKPLFFIETDSTDFAQNFFNKFLKEKEATS